MFLSFILSYKYNIFSFIIQAKYRSVLVTYLLKFHLYNKNNYLFFFGYLYIEVSWQMLRKMHTFWTTGSCKKRLSNLRAFLHVPYQFCIIYHSNYSEKQHINSFLNYSDGLNEIVAQISITKSLYSTTYDFTIFTTKSLTLIHGEALQMSVI